MWKTQFDNNIRIILAELEANNIPQTDFSPAPTEQNYIQISRIPGIDLSKYNLDANQDYYVSQATASKLTKDYF